MISWVVGRSGMLGQAVEGSFALTGKTWHPPARFHWDDEAQLESELRESAHQFAARVVDDDWQIAWCAGAGVVGTDEMALRAETQAFDRFLSLLTEVFSSPELRRGSLFFSSTAGGIYAGGAAPPYFEDSPVSPLGPYGENKLEQENMARRFNEENATPLFIGRLSNLYGVGQDFSKNQGLITQLCLRSALRQPLVLYVPLDTTRDYLYIGDAARLIAGGLERLRVESREAAVVPIVVKNLASRRPTTVGSVLSQIRSVTKRPVRVQVARLPMSAQQVRDLRIDSRIWTDLDKAPIMPLGAGIRTVWNSIIDEIGRGTFSASLAVAAG